MISEDAAGGAEQGRDAAVGSTSGTFVVTFSAAAAAEAEAETRLPRTRATASMRSPFRQPLVVDTDPQSAGWSA